MAVNRRIGTQLHQLYTFATNKRGLCAYDDKRYMVDNVNTLAYGHYRIPEPHVDIDMHPEGPADGGMIVIEQHQRNRAKRKYAHTQIMKAAKKAKPLSVNPEEEEEDDVPLATLRTRLMNNTVSEEVTDQTTQTLPQTLLQQAVQTALDANVRLNNETEQLLREIGVLPD